MKEMTKDEVREIVSRVVDELKLKEIYIPEVVRSAIYVAVGEITGWEDTTSLYHGEIELYMNPFWGGEPPSWTKEEDYDYEDHFETIEEAVYAGAKLILEQQVECETKLEDVKG